MLILSIRYPKELNRTKKFNKENTGGFLKGQKLDIATGTLTLFSLALTFVLAVLLIRRPNIALCLCRYWALEVLQSLYIKKYIFIIFHKVIWGEEVDYFNRSGQKS